jgi:hypothetical protein
MILHPQITKLAYHFLNNLANAYYATWHYNFASCSRRMQSNPLR